MLLLLFVVAAGAVVGAVHGWFLIWLLHRKQTKL
jgi:NhaP-type Na+/H+ or K+/H+ antiporter